MEFPAENTRTALIDLSYANRSLALGKNILLSHKYVERVINVITTAAGGATTTNFNSKLASEVRDRNGSLSIAVHKSCQRYRLSLVVLLFL
jgi:hypothetical protein